MEDLVETLCLALYDCRNIPAADKSPFSCITVDCLRHILLLLTDRECGDPAMLNALAISSFARGRIEQAVRFCDASIKMNSDNIVAYIVADACMAWKPYLAHHQWCVCKFCVNGKCGAVASISCLDVYVRISKDRCPEKLREFIGNWHWKEEHTPVMCLMEGLYSQYNYDPTVFRWNKAIELYEKGLQIQSRVSPSIQYHLAVLIRRMIVMDHPLLIKRLGIPIQWLTMGRVKTMLQSSSDSDHAFSCCEYADILTSIPCPTSSILQEAYDYWLRGCELGVQSTLRPLHLLYDSIEKRKQSIFHWW